MGSCEQERGYIHTVMIDFPIQQGIIIIMHQNIVLNRLDQGH